MYLRERHKGINLYFCGRVAQVLRLVIYEERGTQNCRKELRNLLYRLRARDGVNNRKRLTGLVSVQYL